MSKIIMSHLNVGQGDCTVIMYFDDVGTPIRSILLDCGENNAWGRARDILVANGFDRLHVALITHYDSDHFSGYVQMLRTAKFGNEMLDMLAGTQFWDRGVPYGAFEKNIFDEYVKELAAIRRLQVSSGRTALERRTHNMQGGNEISQEEFNKNSDTLLGDLAPFSESVKAGREIHYYVAPVSKSEVDNHGGLFHWKELTSSRGRFLGYDGLFQRRTWPIELDVANYGFDTKIDLKIVIIFANGTGKFNKGNVDPLEAQLIHQDNDSPEMTAWRNLLWNNFGNRLTGVNLTTDGNQLGLGFHIKYHNFTYWAGGDLTSAQEDALTDEIGTLSILKAGHHGSGHSTSYRFLGETKPKKIIISTANTWSTNLRLPSPETLHRINNAPFVEEIYMTGQPVPESEGLDFLPKLSARYKNSLKFRVSGNGDHDSGTIDVIVTSAQALEDEPDFTVNYLQRNIRKFNQIAKTNGPGLKLEFKSTQSDEIIERPHKRRRLV